MSKSLRTWLTLIGCVVVTLSLACRDAQEPAANSADRPNAANVAQTAPSGNYPAAVSPTPAAESANVPVTGQPANSTSPDKPRAVTIKAKDMTAVAGREIKLEIEVTTEEDLGAVSFTLDFDPAVFKYVSSAISRTAPKSAVLSVNDNQTSAGKLGALVDSSTAFPKGKRTVMTAVFQVVPGSAAGEYKFAFSSKPAIQSVSTIKGTLADAAFLPGTVRVAAPR
jgi:hypothetical protein